MKKKMKKLLLLITIFTLSSCGTTSSLDSTSVATTSSTVDIGGDANIKNIVSYLHQNENYHLTTTVETATSTDTYDSFYNENYYYSSATLSGYAEDENGIFRLNNFQNHFLSSELLFDSNNNKMSNLWSSQLFSSFKDVDPNNFESSAKNEKVTSKLDKLFMLDMMNLSRGLLTEITDFNLSVDEADHLVINITTLESTYTSTINYQNDLSLPELDTYLGTNSYYETSDEEKLLQSSFANDNYERKMYGNDGKTIVGYEHFTPNYYYGEYVDDSNTSSGYIRLSNFTSGGNVYNGIYYFYITDQGIGLSLLSDDLSYDMNSFMNYPSNLLALKNLQFFTYIESLNEHVCVNQTIADDFIGNFQIAKMFPNNTVEGTELSYRTQNDFADDFTVIFTVSFLVDNTSYYMEFEFLNFGAANIEQVDQAFNF